VNTKRLRDRVELKLSMLELEVMRRMEPKDMDRDPTYEYFVRGVVSGIKGSMELVFDAIEEEEFVGDD
jgi:hypothetical protein